MIHNVMVLFPWRMINREHVLMQIHHKNVEACAKKVVVGVEYLL